ncbi:ribonuclease H-like domain-containing protein [Tanacetum coccineum]|uniref:Ribonuclease H-like domain-containing protein n=1 Tax=Tanacetum coccineum TaxID=301880 RepID=A0ABQ5AZI1_9ASTR
MIKDISNVHFVFKYRGKLKDRVYNRSSTPALIISVQHRLFAYPDADWVRCPSTRRPTYSYFLFLGDNLITWSSKRQHVISCSSAEAEYLVVANAIAETVWAHNLIQELLVQTEKQEVCKQEHDEKVVSKEVLEDEMELKEYSDTERHKEKIHVISFMMFVRWK